MPTRPRVQRSYLASSAAVLLAAGPGPPAATERTLDVVASEFAFAAPDTVPAGRTRVRLTNRGREFHILEVVRLDDGHTAEELAAHLTARRPPPAWATFVGGPLARAGGGAPDRTSSYDLAVTVDLAPGRYALICPIPSPGDHRSHLVKGMVRTLVVTPTRRSGRRVPARAAASRVVLVDYGFALEPAWRAGRHAVRVENRAAQPHELVVVRLDPGKRAVDFVRWAGALTGRPPGTIVGGTTALGRGRSAMMTLTLAPGAYALLCFVSDVADGRSHVRHGMTRDLTVR